MYAETDRFSRVCYRSILVIEVFKPIMKPSNLEDDFFSKSSFTLRRNKQQEVVLPGVGGFGLGLLPPPQPKTKTTKKIKKMFKIFVINLRQRKVVH